MTDTKCVCVCVLMPLICLLLDTNCMLLDQVSELKEQCSLEQQAKAHLEQELRSDLEEKDHKIAALLTKVQYLLE